MSGFEIVGVVLAVLPLLISAVENYQSGLNPLKTLLYPSKHRIELHSLKRKLRVQRDLFENSLTTLLLPSISRKTLDILFKNPNGPAWHTPATTEKLKLQLESTHSGCLIVIEDLGDAFKELQKLLCSPKVKFSFQRQRRKELLETIDSYNRNLKAFAMHHESRSVFAQYPRRRTVEGNNKAEELELERLERVRLKASDLHRALKSSFNCKSGLSHTVNLQLEQVIADPKPEPNFRLLFVLSSMSYDGDISAHWNWKEVKIREVLSSESEIKKAEDVCSALTHLAHPQTEQQTSQDLPPEYLESPTGPAQFLLESVQEPLMAQGKAQPSVRLSKILGRPKQSSSDMAGSWYQYHRAKVAVILAHAVLQLHGSPWLSSSWDCSDIQLIATSTRGLSSGGWQPFISRMFKSSSAGEKTSENSKARGPRVPNYELYSLAIVLLELAFNAPLQEKRVEQDKKGAEDYQDAYINYNTACRLTEWDLGCEMGSEFAKVVRHCIYGFPNLAVHNLDSEEFHEEVCAYIIQPLEHNLQLRAPRFQQ